MQLNVHDVAKILELSEKTVYRWVKEGRLPSYRVNDQYRFNRAELLEWATARRINVSPEIFAEPEGARDNVPTLTEALRHGGVFYRVGGTDKPSVLKSVVEIMSLPEEVDREFLLKVLLARESLGSTGIGDGIAIPHVRNPIVLHIPRPMVALCFLEQPIDFGAMDGQPVRTLFTLVSPTIRGHLSLLSKLSFALRDSEFRGAVTRQASRQELLDAAARVEQGLAPNGSQTSTEPSSPAAEG